MTQRADQWLWFARLTKSRTLAAALISKGALRINGAICAKPANPLKNGDVLTLAHGPGVRVLRVVHFGTRRGPAPEAQLLYEDITPLPATLSDAVGSSVGARERGQGRPTKKERRALDQMVPDWDDGS